MEQVVSQVGEQVVDFSRRRHHHRGAIWQSTWERILTIPKLEQICFEIERNTSPIGTGGASPSLQIGNRSLASLLGRDRKQWQKCGNQMAFIDVHKKNAKILKNQQNTKIAENAPHMESKFRVDIMQNSKIKKITEV